MMLLAFTAACSLQKSQETDLASMNVESLNSGVPAVELYYAETRTTYNLSYGRFGRMPVYVEVENLGYHKSVELHYSINGGEWKMANCEYQSSLANNREKWFTQLSLYAYSGDYPIMDIRFALKYTVNGITYWDNNQGRDYFVTTRRMLTGGSYPTFVLGKSSNIKLLNAGYLTNSQGNTIFQAEAVLKNLAYNKNVSLVYTTDGWTNILVKNFSYKSTTAGGDEIWAADFIVSQTIATTPRNINFAVSYDVNGQSYWDNNENRNYNFFLYNQWWHGRD